MIICDIKVISNYDSFIKNIEIENNNKIIIRNSVIAFIANKRYV